MIEKEITLYQALSGVSFTFKHLDARKIRIVNEPGEIVKPDQIKTVEDQGMPFFKKSYKYGNLFIQFKIKFPDKLEPEQIKLLGTVLPNQKAEESKAEAGESETVKMIPFDEEHKNKHVGGGDRGQDSEGEEEDEEGGQGQRIGCQGQ